MINDNKADGQPARLKRIQFNQHSETGQEPAAPARV